MIAKDIINAYKINQSVTQTANQLSVSLGVVRKTLITAGLITTPLTQRIAELSAMGLKQTEIADWWSLLF